MKLNASNILILLLMATSLASCEVVGGIFKAGFYSAIIVLVVVIVLVVWLLRRFRSRD